MSKVLRFAAALAAVWATLLAAHITLLKLPYYWDEAGYYVPAALDFFRHGLLIPSSTLPSGHTPFISIYLAAVWRSAGYSPLATRAAMLLISAATLVATALLARAVSSSGEARANAWQSALLLAIAPLYFAQGSLVFLDLTVALFTVLALLALLGERWAWFAIAASLAVLSKETAIVVVPVAVVYYGLEWRRGGLRFSARVLAALLFPCLPLAVWALYYRHYTGFWTGNATYLQYNLYSTLSPVRMLLCLLRRLHEIFIAGFNWILTASALAGAWWSKKRGNASSTTPLERQFLTLTLLLAAAYLALLSVVGGAILPRYTLPLYPPLFVAAVLYIRRLPARAAGIAVLAAGLGLASASFINPPYPFAFEDNLAYADFIRLHQQATGYLGAMAGNPSSPAPRVLTAWPATNEIETPDLGYVPRPLRPVPVDGFTRADFAGVEAGSFDLVYLYSRKWEPNQNWLTRWPWLAGIEARYFDYQPQMPLAEVESRFNLEVAARWERRGQWAVILRPREPASTPGR